MGILLIFSFTYLKRISLIRNKIVVKEMQPTRLRTFEVVADLSWQTDSGPQTMSPHVCPIFKSASNHVTSYMSNLQIHSTYQDNESLTFGNGSKVTIANIGHNTYPLKENIVSLNHILHVPSINKNLLSIYQLTCDNNCAVELHPNCYFAKDKATEKVVLQGKLKDGLYQLSLHIPKLNNQATSRAYGTMLSKSASDFSPVSNMCVNLP